MEDTQPKDTSGDSKDGMHPKDVDQLALAINTIKDATITHSQNNWGVAGGAAAAGFFGIAEYLATTITGSFANQGVNGQGPIAQDADIVVSANDENNNNNKNTDTSAEDLQKTAGKHSETLKV